MCTTATVPNNQYRMETLVAATGAGLCQLWAVPPKLQRALCAAAAPRPDLLAFTHCAFAKAVWATFTGGAGSTSTGAASGTSTAGRRSGDTAARLAGSTSTDTAAEQESLPSAAPVLGLVETVRQTALTVTQIAEAVTPTAGAAAATPTSGAAGAAAATETTEALTHGAQAVKQAVEGVGGAAKRGLRAIEVPTWAACAAALVGLIIMWSKDEAYSSQAVLVNYSMGAPNRDWAAWSERPCRRVLDKFATRHDSDLKTAA